MNIDRIELLVGLALAVGASACGSSSSPATADRDAASPVDASTDRDSATGHPTSDAGGDAGLDAFPEARDADLPDGDANTSPVDAKSPTETGAPDTGTTTKPQALVLGMNLGDSSGFADTPGTAGNMALADYGAAQFAIMRAAGITTVRIDVGAGYFQAAAGEAGPVPLKGGMDQIIKAAHGAGLEILLIVDASDTMTQDVYVAFLSKLVAYYSQTANGDVHYYEIFNEINLAGGWIDPRNVPTPAVYTTLLHAAYAAIKKADPSSAVLFGSLACGVTGAETGSGGANGYDGASFLQASYDAMGGDSTGYFDIMNVHAYTIIAASGSGYGTTLPNASSLPDISTYYWQDAVNPTASSTLANAGASPAVPSVRYQMVQHGDAKKPIWMTEFGAPTGTLDGYTTTTTYNGEALMYLTALKVLHDNDYNFVQRLYSYVWADSDDDFGVVTSAYSPKLIDGTFAGLPSGTTSVLEAFTSGITFPSAFPGTAYP